MTKEEQEYLLWFFQNTDFGPADSDVRFIMENEYYSKTGKEVPMTLSVYQDE